MMKSGVEDNADYTFPQCSILDSIGKQSLSPLDLKIVMMLTT
jgi:hypothetical protein